MIAAGDATTSSQSTVFVFGYAPSGRQSLLEFDDARARSWRATPPMATLHSKPRVTVRRSKTSSGGAAPLHGLPVVLT